MPPTNKEANIVVLITTKDVDEADKIAVSLTQEKLIACANIFKGVQSVFWWEGKLNYSDEALIVIKTQQRLFKKIVDKVKSLHSYSVPEVIALPIIDGNPEYLKWIDDSLR